jgi:hypothetical protein
MDEERLHKFIEIDKTNEKKNVAKVKDEINKRKLKHGNYDLAVKKY